MQSDHHDFSRTPAYLLLATLFFLPLLINPALSLNFNTVYLNPKALWTVAVILPCAAYVAFVFRGHMDLLTAILLWGWLAWMIATWSVSGQGFLIITGIPNRLQGLPVYTTYALVATATFFWSRQDALASQVLQWTLAALSVPLSLYVALQYYGFAGVINGEATSGVIATLTGATLGNRGYLAGCMALILPAALELSRRSRWGLVFTFLIGFCLTASLTRGALIAAALGTLLWLVQGNGRSYTTQLILGLGLIFPLIHLSPHQISLRAFGSGVGQQAVSDSSGRTPLWNTALVGILERPLLGWGPGQLLNIMANRPDNEVLKEIGIATEGKEITQILREPGSPLSWVVNGGDTERVTQSVDAVHNEFLEYGLSSGIPGTLLYALLYFLGLKRSWMTCPWVASALASYLCYLLVWPETIRFGPLAWAVLGIGLAIISQMPHIPNARSILPKRERGR